METDWRCVFLRSLQGQDAVLFYAADPGAFSFLEALEDVALEAGVKVFWHLEGWAQLHGKKTNMHYDAQGNALKTVFIGQEVDFDRLDKVMNIYSEKRRIFVSDHWKDITGCFFVSGDDAPRLPDEIWVPDEAAQSVQSNGLIEKGVDVGFVRSLVKVFGQPMVEKQVREVVSFSVQEIADWQKKHNLEDRNCILFALDPLEREEDADPGFDWRDALQGAIDMFQVVYPTGVLLVKPHPRQDFKEVSEFVKQYPNVMVVFGNVVPWIAISCEVWGITSIVLLVAKKAGKRILSFQVGRNDWGEAQSNVHLEPFVVSDMQKKLSEYDHGLIR